MEKNIEHIIKNYQYFELDEAQKELISKWAENSDEFDALKLTLVSADEFSQSMNDSLNPTIKQRLDVRFAEKHNQQRLVWYNKLWTFLWPNESPFYKRPLIQFATICLIAVFTIPFFPSVNDQRLALNETGEKEEKNRIDREVEKSSKPEEKTKDIKVETESLSAKEAEEKVKKPEVKSNEQIESFNKDQKGWNLNQDRVSEKSGAEMPSEKPSEILDEVIIESKTDKDASFYSDSELEDQPVARSNFANRELKEAETPKNVQVEETLDLITALY